MKKTVLVSGGAGFIGSHVTVELIQAGYDVVIADNMSNCDDTNYKGVCAILGRQLPFEHIDFCDRIQGGGRVRRRAAHVLQEQPGILP